MPIKKMYTYVCDWCSRSKEQYGVPDNWLVVNNYVTRTQIKCPVCRLTDAKREYERMKIAAEKVLEEELAGIDAPRPEPELDLGDDPSLSPFNEWYDASGS